MLKRYVIAYVDRFGNAVKLDNIYAYSNEQAVHAFRETHPEASDYSLSCEEA